MIDPITGWHTIPQYNNKITISIANLVKTMLLSRYTTSMEIMYDQGSEFIRHELRKFPTEK